MGLGQLVTKWSVCGIARTQFRLFKLAQKENPGVCETVIAPLLFARRMRKVASAQGQDERIAAYLCVNGPVETLRDTCHAIAVVEFKISPMDRANVAYLTEMIDAELGRLGYMEERPGG